MVDDYTEVRLGVVEKGLFLHGQPAHLPTLARLSSGGGFGAGVSVCGRRTSVKDTEKTFLDWTGKAPRISVAVMPTSESQNRARQLRLLIAQHDTTIAAVEREIGCGPGGLQAHIGVAARSECGPRHVFMVRRGLGLATDFGDLFPGGILEACRYFCGDLPPVATPYDLDQLGDDLRAVGIEVVDVAELRDRAEVREAARFGWGQVLMVVRWLLGGG